MPYDLSREYTTDTNKEEKGVWESVGGDGELLIAAWNNDAFNDAFANQPRRIRRKLDRGKLTSEEDRLVMVDIVAKTILLGWKNIVDKGKVIKYSYDNARKMLLQYKKFYAEVVAISTDESRYQLDDEEDNVKNS